MADFSFEVEKRSEFGKGFARRARAAGQIPAVIYAKGETPEHIVLPAHETTRAVRLPNALFEVKIGAKQHLALVKDIQRDFVTRDIEHIDLLEVKESQLVDVRVALKVEGEAKPGTTVTTSFQSLLIKVKAVDIPRFVTLNVDGAEIGTHFTIADVNFPAGAVAHFPEDTIVTTVKERVLKKVEQVDVAGGGEEAPAEGEEGASEEAAAE